MKRRRSIVRNEGAQVEASGATSDDELIRMWLHGRPETTQTAYRSDLAWWKARKLVPPGGLRAIKLRHIQAAIDAQAGESTMARRKASLRSLLTFGHRVGYLAINVGAVLPSTPAPNKLAERILEPDEVIRLLAAAAAAPRQGARDHLFCRMAYVSGARVSELVRLDWQQIHASPKGGSTLTLRVKGGRTRHVWITEGTTAELVSFRGPDEARTGPVFQNRYGGRLAARDAERLVEAAAKRAKLPKVSPHWLRHGHATHALERGAPIHEVSADLGHRSVATTSRYLHARPGPGSARFLGL